MITYDVHFEGGRRLRKNEMLLEVECGGPSERSGRIICILCKLNRTIERVINLNVTLLGSVLYFVFVCSHARCSCCSTYPWATAHIGVESHKKGNSEASAKWKEVKGNPDKINELILKRKADLKEGLDNI